MQLRCEVIAALLTAKPTMQRQALSLFREMIALCVKSRYSLPEMVGSNTFMVTRACDALHVYCQVRKNKHEYGLCFTL